MKLLAIDPGYGNCGWVFFSDYEPKHWGGWFSTDFGKGESALSKSLRITAGLINVANLLHPDCFITESIITGANRGHDHKTSYNRGMFDTLLTVAFGHLPRIVVHNTHMKKFVTGNGRAGKDMMRDWFEHRMSEYDHEFMFNSVRENYPVSKYEHILDAWGMGMIGGWLLRERQGDVHHEPSIHSMIQNKMEPTAYHEPLWEEKISFPEVTSLLITS